MPGRTLTARSNAIALDGLWLVHPTLGTVTRMDASAYMGLPTDSPLLAWRVCCDEEAAKRAAEEIRLGTN